MRTAAGHSRRSRAYLSHACLKARTIARDYRVCSSGCDKDRVVDSSPVAPALQVSDAEDDECIILQLINMTWSMT